MFFKKNIFLLYMRSFKKNNKNMKQKKNKIKQKGSSRFITGLRRKKTKNLSTNQTLPPRLPYRQHPADTIFAVPSNLRNIRRQSKKPVKSPSELQIIYNNPLPTMSRRQIQSRKLPSNFNLNTQAIPKSERHLMEIRRIKGYGGEKEEDIYGTLERLGFKPRISKRPRKRFFGKH